MRLRARAIKKTGQMNATEYPNAVVCVDNAGNEISLQHVRPVYKLSRFCQLQRQQVSSNADKR
jgi:tRNA U54 and U55 pseudouridine synthase Pus10